MPPRTPILLLALLILVLTHASVGQECPTVLGPESTSERGLIDEPTVRRLNHLRLRPVSRLKGGVEALPESLRYVATFRRSDDGPFLNCSASILDSRWLLTAKSCQITKDFTAVFGSLPKKPLEIEEVFEDANLDAALVKLKEVKDLTTPNNTHITSVRVNDNSKFPEVGVQARAMAFQNIAANDKIGDLMQVEVPILDSMDCMDANYSKDFTFDKDKMICAGDENCDYCEGDSGGPLLQFDQSKNKRPVIVGIISNSNLCGVADTPGVYTRVSALIEFLKKQKKDNGLVFTSIDNDPKQVKPSASPTVTPTSSVSPTASVTPSTPSPSPSPSAIDANSLKGGSSGNSTLWIIFVVGIVGVLFTAGAWWRYRFATE